MKKLSKKMKISITIITILLVLIGAVALVVYNSLNKVETKALPKTDEALGITKEKEEEKTQGEKNTENVVNIALYGVDKRDGDAGRSDSIMILSINYHTKKIKLSSIMRDTYVSVEGYGNTKINHAYAYGGPLLSIKTMNQNFGLDIRDYVLVDFDGLKDIVDQLGGVDIEIKDYELTSMKNYGINKAGKNHLNGTQALAYCRIRYQGNGDYERTDRQREVLEKLFDGVKTKNVVQMTELINKILPYVETSFTKTDILGLGTNVVSSGITTLEQKRFPVTGYCHGEMIGGVYYLVIDKEATKKQIKEFIYN